MCRILGVLILMAMLVPRPSTALQLHWGSGGASLSFTEATRCTLVVQADSSESRLPSEWRLLWVADSSTDISPVPIDAQLACEEDLAQVSAVDEPANAADSAAHLRTIQFCSDEGPIATVAQYLLDLPAESRGRFKAVALDPNDSTQVIESNEVTFNGGAWGEYPAVILRATSVHNSIYFRLTATGSGLQSVRTLSLMAPDSSWSLPLSLSTASNRELTTVDSIAGLMPECRVRASGSLGEIATTSLAEDPPPQMSGPVDCLGFFLGSLDTLTLQPKDFAFVPGGYFDAGNNYAFHVFYIRSVRAHLATSEKDFGHAVSVLGDLNHWIVLNRNVLHVAPTGWESNHVWAPSIVRQGPFYKMLYAGVDANDDQRIGLASSTNLNTWTRGTEAVYTVSSVGWADHVQRPTWPSINLRDPCVIPDPDVAGHWLMFYVTVHGNLSPSQMVVGVAGSDGDLAQWHDIGPILKTRGSLVGTSRIESPSVFWRNGKWWIVYTKGLPVRDSLMYITTASSRPDDLDPSHWSDPQRFYTAVEGAAESDEMGYWKGSEYLSFANAGNVEFLAAYDDTTEALDFARVPASPPYEFALGCTDLAGVEPESDAARPRLAGLTVESAMPSRDAVSFSVALPSPAEAHLAIYDLLGRRVRTLVHGTLAAGATSVRWDGRAGDGAFARSGVYFARLTLGHGQYVRRVMLVR